MLFLAVVLLLLLPFQWTIPVVMLGDVPLFRMGALVLIGSWLVLLLWQRGKLLLPMHLLLPCLGFLGIALLGVLMVPETTGDWMRKYFFLGGLLPLCLVWYYLLHPKHASKLLRALLAGAVLSALLGIGIFMLQFWVGAAQVFEWLTQLILPFFLGDRLSSLVTAFPSLLVNINGETWLRVTALFPDPHVAAFFFGMSAFLALGMFLKTQERRWCIFAGILIVADLLTFSRGGYMGLAIGISVFCLLQIKGWRPSFRQLALLGLAPLMLWLAFPVLTRFVSSFTLGDTSSLARLALWREALSTWQAHPFFGVGLGQYADSIHPFVGTALPYYAHNLLLDVGVELGIFGLGFLLWLIGAALIGAVFKAQAGDGMMAGVAAALSVYLGHSLFETSLFSLHVTALLTFCLALAYRPHVFSKQG